MDNCIFCKIVRKEIPCHQVYENGNFLVFLDVHPRNEGHCLIIPKKHYRWVWDIKEEYSTILNKLAQALKRAFYTDFVVSFIIGEEVPHAHIHLVPRFEHDGHGALINPSIVRTFSPEEMKECAARIKSFL